MRRRVIVSIRENETIWTVFDGQVVRLDAKIIDGDTSILESKKGSCG